MRRLGWTPSSQHNHPTLTGTYNNIGVANCAQRGTHSASGLFCSMGVPQNGCIEGRTLMVDKGIINGEVIEVIVMVQEVFKHTREELRHNRATDAECE